MTRLISSVGTRIVVERFAQLLAPERWIYAFLRNKAIYPRCEPDRVASTYPAASVLSLGLSLGILQNGPTNEIGVKTIVIQSSPRLIERRS